MLDIISDGFKKASERLQGKTTLTEDNIAQSLKDIRTSLLEADVAYPVVKDFLSKVKDKSLGKDIKLKAGKGNSRLKVGAGDHFVSICQDELVDLMGPVDTSFSFNSNGLSHIMMIGLQGTGKTTTTAKVAYHLKHEKNRKPLLVACDIYRPAAAQQLKVLGEKINVPTFHLEGKTPLEIATQAQKYAKEHSLDTILLDTAGRLTIDDTLMNELKEIKESLKPENILLVCDAMMGQDAVTTAKDFDTSLDVSGFVMTKLDGDSRGGAALSIKAVIGKPIKFLGMGEDFKSLEEFRPEGLASRILGMGDVVGLMDDFKKVADDQAEQDAEKMLSGQFNLKDFYKQISMIQKMGSLKDIMAKMPMQNMIPKGAQVDDGELKKVKVMIDSMTEKERVLPHLLNESRVKRIAKGSGKAEHEVWALIKKFKQMQQMMGKMGKNMGGLMNKIPGLNKLGGSMPDMSQLSSMMRGDSGANSFSSQIRKVDRDKLKKLRKQAQKSRKKNRKK